MTHCIERARAGDPGAREALAEQLRPRLERMAGYYARRCGEDPDDLLQEAWLGLLEALPQVDLRIGSPEQHLVQRARWRLLDAIKRARLRRCAPLEEETPGPGAPVPEVAAGRADVDRFLAGLKSSQRAIVECLLQGLTWREAGSVLGCTSANVAYHMRQIRRQYERWNGAG
ncbi:MAG TPA: sigma-70 family RNA polymerase sigma factor [Armatimonadota bacterium]|nr:sigma-70 family RNA polymerase sigma factor [Armatimonadota bacterium]